MAPRPTPPTTESYDVGSVLPGATAVENSTGEPEPVVAPTSVADGVPAPTVGEVPAPDPTRFRVGQIEYSIEDARRLGLVGTPVAGP